MRVVPYIAMEYSYGVRLRHRIARRPLETEALCRVEIAKARCLHPVIFGLYKIELY